MEREGKVISAKWLFTFQGRLRRGGWWLAFLVQLIIVVVAGSFAGLIVTGGQPETVPPRDTADPSAVVIMLAAFVVATWISLATSVKRLHDLGVSGWWIVPLYVASTLGSAVSSAAPPGGGLLGLLVSIVGLVLTFGPIVYLGAVPGQGGDNRFGPDPGGEAVPPASFGETGTDEAGSGPGGRVESFSGELRELQRLLDDGVISRDEFDRKKKQILGI